MALEHASGVIHVPAADAVGTTYSVTSLSFQPKAIRFFSWMDSRDNTLGDVVTEALHGRFSIGFATSTTDRRAVGSVENDTSASMGCSAAWSESAVAVGTALASISLQVDIDAFLSNGFRLIKDVDGGGSGFIFWEAWGGDDITVAATVAIAEPAATGDQDYTVTGFVADATDQVVMLAGIQSTSAVDTVARNDSGLCVGFASGTADADNVVVVGNNDDGSANADTDGYCKTGECLAMITTAGGNPNARAKLTAFLTNAFRLNWIARGVTNRRYIALAIKGGRWKAGSYTIDGSTASATATVSGLSFTPLGVSLIGRMTAENTAGTATAQSRFSFGSGTSTSARRAVGHLSEDGTGTQEVNVTAQLDQVLAYPSTTGTLQSAYDINAMNSDGFQIIVDTAGGVASEWQGYLTFGSVPLNAYTLTLDPGSYSLTGTTASAVSGRIISAGSGSYSLTGTTATLSLQKNLVASPGAYALSGIDTTLLSARILSAPSGSYSINGAAAALGIAREFTLDPGSYSISGSSTTTALTRAVVAAPGSYAISGSTASLVSSRFIVASPGSYAVSGVAATLFRDWVLVASPGTYALLGADTVLGDPDVEVVVSPYIPTFRPRRR